MKEIFSLGEPDDRDQSKLEMKMWDPECPLTRNNWPVFLWFARYSFWCFQDFSYAIVINQTCMSVSFKTVIFTVVLQGEDYTLDRILLSKMQVSNTEFD